MTQKNSGGVYPISITHAILDKGKHFLNNLAPTTISYSPFLNFLKSGVFSKFLRWYRIIEFKVRFQLNSSRDFRPIFLVKVKINTFFLK